jgi:hypothetical protein
MTDADTIRNAEDLWALVHLVQDTIDKSGGPLLAGDQKPLLARLRALADECDPEYGRF